MVTSLCMSFLSPRFFSRFLVKVNSCTQPDLAPLIGSPWWYSARWKRYTNTLLEITIKMQLYKPQAVEINYDVEKKKKKRVTIAAEWLVIGNHMPGHRSHVLRMRLWSCSPGAVGTTQSQSTSDQQMACLEISECDQNRKKKTVFHGQNVYLHHLLFSLHGNSQHVNTTR